PRPAEPVAPPTIVLPRSVRPSEAERPAEMRKEPSAHRPAPEPEPPAARRGASYTLHDGRTSFTIPPLSRLTGEAQALLPIDREGLTATAGTPRPQLAALGLQGPAT